MYVVSHLQARSRHLVQMMAGSASRCGCVEGEVKNSQMHSRSTVSTPSGASPENRTSGHRATNMTGSGPFTQGLQFIRSSELVAGLDVRQKVLLETTVPVSRCTKVGDLENMNGLLH